MSSTEGVGVEGHSSFGGSFIFASSNTTSKEPPKLECPSTPNPCGEDTEKRLKEAENRRKSMEASTLEKLAQEEKKREEVRAKKASVSETDEKEEEEKKEAA
jgi:hypothetical protein